MPHRRDPERHDGVPQFVSRGGCGQGKGGEDLSPARGNTGVVCDRNEAVQPIVDWDRPPKPRLLRRQFSEAGIWVHLHDLS
jgi:hypothetical protein